MYDNDHHFVFGCARLQPTPLTSPSLILPSQVTHYTIYAYGEQVRDIGSKFQWMKASFYFRNIDRPLDIYAPDLRIGYTEPCPEVCRPVLRDDGKMSFEPNSNPYFSTHNWENGLKSLFEVIRSHHHLEGNNGNDRLLRSTSYNRESGIHQKWYSLPSLAVRGDLRKAIQHHLLENPDVLDRCFGVMREMGMFSIGEPLTPRNYFQALSQPPQDTGNETAWTLRWKILRDWWADWEEDFLTSTFQWDSEEDRHKVLVEQECAFQDSFFAQLLVEETLPFILRGVLWRMALSLH